MSKNWNIYFRRISELSLRCTTATADGRRISDICTLSSSNDLHLLPNNTVLLAIIIEGFRGRRERPHPLLLGIFLFSCSNIRLAPSLVLALSSVLVVLDPPLIIVIVFGCVFTCTNSHAVSGSFVKGIQGGFSQRS